MLVGHVAVKNIVWRLGFVILEKVRSGPADRLGGGWGGRLGRLVASLVYKKEGSTTDGAVLQRGITGRLADVFVCVSALRARLGMGPTRECFTMCKRQFR